MRSRTRRWAGAGAAAMAIAAWAAYGCGGEQVPGPAAPEVTAAADAGQGGAAEAGHDIPGVTRVGSEKLVDRRARSALAPDTLDQVRASSAPPKTAKEIYRAVAPATVIIRVSAGLGSGVIIDPDGWVLTNHHVVAQGEREDFRIKVSVILGGLSAQTGAMERRDKVYEAEVYKADKLRDLALLRIAEPPGKLPSVTLAAQRPMPGERVVALGHASAGMLWAMKPGEISALGKLDEHLAALASFRDDDEGKEARELFKKVAQDHNLGLVIQSTCNVLPGDSGGPLVNQGGELVGLNAFSNRDPQTGGLLSFHVHLDEMRKFLDKRPQKPARLLPDPWQEGGGDLSFEDVDLDGRVDMLLMQGRKPCSFCPRQSTGAFFDLDQNSYAAGRPLPKLNDVFEKRDFDAELVYLQLEEDALLWYDSDNDGDYDVLMSDAGSTGMITAGYRILPDGDLNKDPDLSAGRLFRASLFRNEALRHRFSRMVGGAFPARYLDGSLPLGAQLPDPVGASGRVSFGDLNSDGRNDGVDISTAFSKRLLLDLDQSSVPQLSSEIDVSDPRARKAIDAEVAVVSQANQMWVWYDSDDDGRWDLLLHSPGERLYVAAEAWSVDVEGKRTAAAEHVGRKLMRPGIFREPALAEALRAMVGEGLLHIMSASDDGVGSFPEPVEDHRGAGYALLDLRQAPKAVVTVEGQGSNGYLIDLDQNSLLGRPARLVDVEQTVTDGKFETEFAYFLRNGIAWSYYDTDNSGGYDLVLVALEPELGKATSGFRIDAQGAAALDPDLAGTALVQHALFGNPLLARRMQQLGEELFAENMLAP